MLPPFVGTGGLACVLGSCCLKSAAKWCRLLEFVAANTAGRPMGQQTPTRSWIMVRLARQTPSHSQAKVDARL